MSNKANVTNGYIGEIADALDSLTVSGHYLYIDGSNIFGGSTGWMYDVEVSIQDYSGSKALVQTATRVYGGGICRFIRNYYYANTPQWSSWVQIATATPPLECPLILAEGLVNGAMPPKYYKDTSGFICVSGLILPEVNLARHQLLATLPVGFRPARETPCSLVDTNGNAYMGYVDVNGEIKLINAPLPVGFGSAGYSIAVFHQPFYGV